MNLDANRWRVALLVVFVLSLVALSGTVAAAQTTQEEDPSFPFDQPETWIAGETSVSGLSPEAKRRLTGIPSDGMDEEIRKAQAAAVYYPSLRMAPPPAVDWRDNLGGDWTTPIRDQSACGSCVAFGVNATIEARMEIAAGNELLEPDLSESHLFFCGCGACCGWGWYPSSALNFAKMTGIVDEACNPYSIETQTCSPCANWEARVTRISDYFGIADANQAKEIIANQGPVVASMSVYSDFFNYRSGIYRHVWGDFVGGHCIAIVGYDDEGGYWIAKNSWGTGWGEEGWFRIAYDQEITPTYYPVLDCVDNNEPNNSAQRATSLSYEEDANGVICSEGDVDFFVFQGSENEQVLIDVDALSLGSSLSAGLTLYGGDGAIILAEAIAREGSDPGLSFVLPYTGNYYVKIEEVLAPGTVGTASFYTLRLQPAPDIVVTGTPVTAQIELGATDLAEVVITNNGDGPLEVRTAIVGGGFSLSQPSPVTSALATGNMTLSERDKAAREMSFVEPAAVIFERGPDGFGYTVVDSYSDDGPRFNWIEIAPPAGGHGIQLSDLNGVDDGYYWPVNLPFLLPFYGAEYDQIGVSTNGLLAFEAVDPPISGWHIPDEYSGIERYIAPYWSDLVVNPGAIYVQDFGALFVVEYFEVTGYGDCLGNGSWQVILFANGNILFQYKDTSLGCYADHGAAASVGVQGSGTVGLEYSFRQPIVADNLAVCFAYPGMSQNCWDADWLTADYEWMTIFQDEAAILTLSLDSAQTQIGQPGSYQALLHLISNDPDTPIYQIPVTMDVSPPPTWGRLTGAVHSSGYCGTEDHPIAGAQTIVAGTSDSWWIVNADREGTFSFWLDEAAGPLTMIAGAPAHISQSVSGIDVLGGETTDQMMTLDWLQSCIELSPSETIDVNLILGQQMTETLTLENRGASATQFSIVSVLVPDEALDEGLQAAASQAVLAAAGKSTTRSPAVMNTAPMVQADDFGYTVRDVDDPDGPVYGWFEIAPPEGGSGIELTALNFVDDGYLWPVELPFTFNFYGVDYDQISISSNGTVYFGDAYHGYLSHPLPGSSDSDVETFIAHLWKDLVVFPGAVYYEQIGPNFVIEFYKNIEYRSDWENLFDPDIHETATWQLILSIDGSILMQYKDMPESIGDDAVIGIQGDATTGIQYAGPADPIRSPMAVCFAAPGASPDCRSQTPWLTFEPDQGSIAPNSEAEISVFVDTATPELEPGDLRARAYISSDDPRRPLQTVDLHLHIDYYALSVTERLTGSGDPGSTVTHVLTITNEGTVEDSYELHVTPDNWAVAVPVMVGPVAPDASATAAVEISIPTDAAAYEEETVVVTVESLADFAKQAQSTLTTSANAVYAFSASPAGQPSCVEPGETAIQTVTLHNSGNISDTYELAVVTSNWPVDVAGSVGPVAPGVSTSVAMPVMVPASVAPGTRDLAIIEVASTSDASVHHQFGLLTCTGMQQIFLPSIMR